MAYANLYTFEVFNQQQTIIKMEVAPSNITKEISKIKNGERNSPDEKEICNNLSQLLLALEFLFSNYKIYHLNIKPGNILYYSESNLKFTDYGFANDIKKAQNENLEKNQETNYFRSPELIAYRKNTLDRIDDEKCDIFSLGLVFLMFA